MSATTPGLGDGARELGDSAGREAHRPSTHSTETKHSSKTSELYVWAAVTLGILVAGLVTRSGDSGADRLVAKYVWLYVAIVTVGYLVSRGLAKSGSRDPYTDDRR